MGKRGRKIKFGIFKFFAAMDAVRAIVELWPAVRVELDKATAAEGSNQLLGDFRSYLDDLIRLARRSR